MHLLCEKPEKLDISEALELFDQLPDGLKDIALSHMRGLLKGNNQE